MTFDDESFTDPGPNLDQGDFLWNVPWGLIEAPVTICRPAATAATKGSATYSPAAATANAFKSGRHEVIHAKGGAGFAVVLWHGCQIDKWKHRKDPSKAFAGIAPVFVLAEKVPEDEHRVAIMAGDHRSYFPLPPFKIGDITMAETIVDLRHIWPVRQSVLLNEATRIAAMGAHLRMALCEHLFGFFTRTRFTEMAPCPNCHSQIDLNLFRRSAGQDDD